MVDIRIELSDLDWISEGDVHVVGKAFLSDDLLKTSDLHRAFRDVSSYEEFREFVTELNGQFAVIMTHNNGVWVGVDHIRTHPVFYAVFDEKIYVGDDFPTIDDAIEFKRPDRVSAMEFITAGYPSGAHTLHPDIKKMCAGEVLQIETSDQVPAVGTEEYFRYRQNPEPIDDEEELLELIDEALTNAFERTIEVIDGRKVLLPLTGGYDSRLVGLMLRDQGYENVHTFCHNLEDEVDLEISQRVASDLDYSWQGMNHTQEELDQIRQSQEWLSLRENIGGYGTLHPASRHLLTFNKLTNRLNGDKDTVLLRGDHAAAPGVFMPDLFESASILTEKTAINTLFDYHYNLCLWNRREHKNDFYERIMESIPHADTNSNSAVIDLIEYWYWRERTPNRLLPHQLVLYQNKMSSWFPLWDKEFVRVMSFIPFRHRLNKKLYKTYVTKKYNMSVGDWQSTSHELNKYSLIQSLEQTFGKYFVGTILEDPMRILRNKIRFLFSQSSCDFDYNRSSSISINEINSSHIRAQWILQNRQEGST